MPLERERCNVKTTDGRWSLSNRVGTVGILFCVFVSLHFRLLSTTNTFVREDTTTFGTPKLTIQISEGATNAPLKRSKSRISFRLHRNLTYNNTFNPTIRCPLGEKSGFTGNGNRKRWYSRRGLPPELQSRGILDFVTTVSTSLNIMFMGDSVAIEVAQGFEEAVGALFKHRRVLREAWGQGHETMAVSAPVRGGGVVASWRLTALLQRSAEGKSLPNAPGGGWLREDARKLLNFSYPIQQQTSSDRTSVGSMDVLVFRIMHGWIPFSDITINALQEVVELSHELLGIKTVIFMTVPFSNNVKTKQDLKDMDKTNAMIREFCHSWQPLVRGVQRVLVHEYGIFTDALLEKNAQAIGINISTENKEFMLNRLDFPPAFPVSIAHGCATLPHEQSSCHRNFLTRDGMHPCMETIGARLFASLACILGCVYNHEDTELDINPDSSFVRQCESDCNRRFMTLLPVDESAIHDGQHHVF